eukprot:superscaffoldBa00001769_g11940
MHGTTIGEDVAKAFTNHFEEKGVDIKKISAVTTDGAPINRAGKACERLVKACAMACEELMFFTVITGHLNEFNLQLQGAGQTVLALFDAWTAFVAKIGVYSRDIQSGTFRYFKHLKKLSGNQIGSRTASALWLFIRLAPPGFSWPEQARF